jgi:hypothetical protein
MDSLLGVCMKDGVLEALAELVGVVIFENGDT